MSALSPPSPYPQAKAEAVAGAAGAMVAPVRWPAVVPGSSTGFGALREAGPTVRKAGPISMKRLELFRLAAPKDSGAHRYPGTVTDVLPPAPAPLPTTLAEASEAGRTLIMGIINVTPDSFSDGGRWDTTDLAVAHGRQLRAQGADLLDVGGESTRPGAARITPATEQERIIPVVRALAASGAAVSVDTVHAATAEAAVGAGAVIVNDVSGGLADPAMHRVVADTGVVYICQHWRGDPETMDRLTDYSALGGVVDGVETELREAGRHRPRPRLRQDPCAVLAAPDRHRAPARRSGAAGPHRLLAQALPRRRRPRLRRGRPDRPGRRHRRHDRPGRPRRGLGRESP